MTISFSHAQAVRNAFPIVAETLHDDASADIASLMATLRTSIPLIWPDAVMEDRIAS